MIQRINLVERQAFTFTYERIVQAFFVVLLINVVIAGSQYLIAYRLQPQITAATLKLEEVTAENTFLTTKQKQPKKKRVSIGEYQQLFDTLQALPKWSKLIKVISMNLPNSVWINSMRTAGAAQSKEEAINAVKKKDGMSNDIEKKEAAINAMEGNVVTNNLIEITGVGNDVRAITEFTAKLDRSPIFEKLQLVETQKEDFGYNFKIQSLVVTEYVE